MTEQKMKRCIKGDDCVHPNGCLQPATTEYFYKRKDAKDGLRGVCRACCREHNRQWYQDNPDKARECSRRWSQDNAEHKREYNRQWSQDNAEHKREYNRQWQKDNLEKERARKRQWYQDNLEKERARVHNYRARKRNLPDTLTTEQIDRMFDYFDHKCAVCGTPQDMFIKLELDHWIPISSEDCTGTIATNIVPLCGGSEFTSHIGCNPSKNDKDAMEWLIQRFGKREAKKIYQRIQDYFNWVREQDE